MKVIKVRAEDYFKDNNNGLIYGLEEVKDSGDFPDYIEWFETEEERNKTIKDNNMMVV